VKLEGIREEERNRQIVWMKRIPRGEEKKKEIGSSKIKLPGTKFN